MNLLNYCKNKKMKRIRSWIGKSMVQYWKNRDYLGAISRHQLEREYKYKTIPERRFKCYLSALNRNLPKNPKGGDGEFLSYLAKSKTPWRLTKKPKPAKCGFVLNLQLLVDFIQNIYVPYIITKDDSGKSIAELGIEAINENEIIDSMSDENQAIEFSKKLSNLPKYRPDRNYFWVADVTGVLESKDLFLLNAHKIDELIDLCGLLHFTLGPKNEKRFVVAIKIDNKAYSSLTIPTTWHARGYKVFRPFNYCARCWGRAVNLRTLENGLPEAVSRSIKWKKGFLACGLGYMNNGASKLTTHDFKELYKRSRNTI